MSRRKAREEALRILYPLEVGRNDLDEILQQAGEIYGKGDEWPFAKEIVAKVHEHLPEIDRLIEAHAEHWSLGRIAAVDRSILRIGAAEMLYCPDIPHEVILNEAIELAKKYGDTDSGSFVNGILAGIHRQLQLERAGGESR